MVFSGNAQSFPYWDPYLASPLNCDYFSPEHNGPIAARNGTLFALRSYYGGTPTRLVRWDHNNGWTEIGTFETTTLSGATGSILVKSNYLYVGGSFDQIIQAGFTNYVTNIAKMNIDTGTWSQVGDGSLTGTITAIYVDDLGRVYAGRDQWFTEGISSLTNLFVMTNGLSWNPIVGISGFSSFAPCTNVMDPGYPVEISTIVGDNTNIYVGGYFAGAYNGSTEVDSPFVIKWNGTNWEKISDACDYCPQESGPWVYSLVLQGTNLFVGGDFSELNNLGAFLGSGTNPSGVCAAGLYRYSTVTKQIQSFVGLGDYDSVEGIYYGKATAGGMVLQGTNLYVVGEFDYVYDYGHSTLTWCSNIVRWDGQNWHALADGIDPTFLYSPFYIAAATNAIFASGYDVCFAGGLYSPEMGRWVLGPDSASLNTNEPTRVISAPNYTAYAVDSPAAGTLRESQRSQQVYGALQFPAGPIKITELRFRPAQPPYGGAFSTTISNIQINLSTTPNGPDALSTTFADNVGGDDTVVYSGPLSISSAYTGDDNGPRDADIVIHLQTPFFYDPANGNLLLDIHHFSNDTSTNAYVECFGEYDDAGSRVVSLDVNSATAGWADTGIDAVNFVYEGAGVCPVPNYTEYAVDTPAAGTLRESQRSQQVYQALQFPPGAITITELRFRPAEAPYGGAFSTTISNIQINLSTTANGPDALSTTFADNVGADDTVVYSGSLSISSAYTGNDNGPRDADIIVHLQTPFTYYPTNGNLLLDIHHFSNDTSTNDYVECFGEYDDAGSRVVSLDVNSATAGWSDTGIDAVEFIYEGAGTRVAPNYTAYTNTPYASGTFREAQRSQQVYQRLQFPSGTIKITELRFRPAESPYGSAFSTTITNIQINLSTTTNGPDALSTTFSDNVGADDTVVYSGSLTLTTAFTGNDNGPRDADIVIHLQTPFVYDPSGGNLLLDIRHFSDDSSNPAFVSVFGESDDTGSRAVCSSNPYSTTASFSDTGIDVVNFIYEKP